MKDFIDFFIIKKKKKIYSTFSPIFSDTQYFIQMVALAVSRSNLFLIFVIAKPETENARSDETDVA